MSGFNTVKCFPCFKCEKEKDIGMMKYVFFCHVECLWHDLAVRFKIQVSKDYLACKLL